MTTLDLLQWTSQREAERLCGLVSRCGKDRQKTDGRTDRRRDGRRDEQRLRSPPRSPSPSPCTLVWLCQSVGASPAQDPTLCVDRSWGTPHKRTFLSYFCTSAHSACRFVICYRVVQRQRVCDPAKYHLSAQYSPGYPSSLPLISLTDPVPQTAEFVPRSGVTILSASETSGLMGAVDHSFTHSAGPSVTVRPGALRTGQAWHSQYSCVGLFDPGVSSPSCQKAMLLYRDTIPYLCGRPAVPGKGPRVRLQHRVGHSPVSNPPLGKVRALGRGTGLACSPPGFPSWHPIQYL